MKRRGKDRRLRKLDDPHLGDRDAALRRLAVRTEGLTWSSGLFALLLDELGDVDELEDLIGKIKALPPQRRPQAVALAIALRYSWRRDQFGWIARRICALANRPSRTKSP